MSSNKSLVDGGNIAQNRSSNAAHQIDRNEMVPPGVMANENNASSSIRSQQYIPNAESREVIGIEDKTQLTTNEVKHE